MMLSSPALKSVIAVAAAGSACGGASAVQLAVQYSVNDLADFSWVVG